MGMEVAGQRLTFPFPFVHQQPHDCGNKTINRWETSLWNLSYNLSAVNIVSSTVTWVSHLLDRRGAQGWRDVGKGEMDSPRYSLRSAAIG